MGRAGPGRVPQERRPDKDSPKTVWIKYGKQFIVSFELRNPESDLTKQFLAILESMKVY